MERRITILGIGNPLMGDDAVGHAVIKELRSHFLPPSIRLAASESEGIGCQKYFQSSDLIIVIDAISAGAEPGTIFRFHPQEPGTLDSPVHHSHGLGISSLIAITRLQGRNPEVLIYGVQFATLEPGHPLTPSIAAATRRVSELILEEIGIISPARKRAC